MSAETKPDPRVEAVAIALLTAKFQGAYSAEEVRRRYAEGGDDGIAIGHARQQAREFLAMLDALAKYEWNAGAQLSPEFFEAMQRGEVEVIAPFKETDAP